MIAVVAVDEAGVAVIGGWAAVGTVGVVVEKRVHFEGQERHNRQTVVAVLGLRPRENKWDTMSTEDFWVIEKGGVGFQ